MSATSLKSPQPRTTPTAPAVEAPRQSRGFLYITAAITGAAIMIVEILGAKMLSPYVGTSHFVWTAQIAVTLVALAVGYFVGGRIADKTQDLKWMFLAIMVAAIYLAITVVTCDLVAYRCLDLNLAFGTLIASTVLFFPPLALLAMTGPFLMRVITASVAGVGGTMGRLTGISTLGSFCGTLLIGYAMIPFLPNSMAMYLTALLLFLISCLYFLLIRKKGTLVVLVPLLLLAGLGVTLKQRLGKEYESVIELFRGNSHFGQLQVVDTRTGTCRYYLNDFLTQNTYDPRRKQSMSQFTYMLSGLARSYTTNITDVLCIGLGVGMVPMDFARHGARVEVVEINPAVVPVAERFFDLDRKKITLHIDDGRHFLNRCPRKYDAVILDAFLGDSSPSHLFSHEAFASVRRVLRPGGVLVINAFGDLEPGHDFFIASLHKTLKSVFPGVRIHTNGDGGMFLVATDHPDPEFLHQPDLVGVHPAVETEARSSYYGLVDTVPDHGIVLTDNYNPAEFYDAHNREHLRRILAFNARNL